MRIDLVGGMGIGKTTLCSVLTEIGYHCILEDLGENPFLAKMYQDHQGFRFPSQMWFILSKYAELRAELKSNEINVIDQSVLNVRAYTNLLFDRRSFQYVIPTKAGIQREEIIDRLDCGLRRNDDSKEKQTSDDQEWDIITRMFSYIDHTFGKPDLLIYLKASPVIQMKRIQSRNRDYELDVTVDYLENLRSEIEALLRAERAAGQAVIEIDTDNIFLADHHIFAAQLAEQIADRLKFCINPRQEAQAMPLPFSKSECLQSGEN